MNSLWNSIEVETTELMNSDGTDQKNDLRIKRHILMFIQSKYIFVLDQMIFSQKKQNQNERFSSKRPFSKQTESRPRKIIMIMNQWQIHTSYNYYMPYNNVTNTHNL